MTPREHMEAALYEASWAHTTTSRPVVQARREGRAAGHAFRALEILYDREQAALAVERYAQSLVDEQTRNYLRALKEIEKLRALRASDFDDLVAANARISKLTSAIQQMGYDPADWI